MKPKDHYNHAYETTVEFEISEDVCIEIDFDCYYSFESGYPATGPSFSCGGEPGMPDQVIIDEIVFAETVCVNGIFYPKGTILRAEGVEDNSLLECALNMKEDEELEEEILLSVYDNYEDPGY